MNSLPKTVTVYGEQIFAMVIFGVEADIRETTSSTGTTGPNSISGAHERARPTFSRTVLTSRGR